MTPPYTQADALLHISARVQRMQTNLQLLQQNMPPGAPADIAAWLADQVRKLEAVIDEHRATHNIYAENYSTGVPISSVLDFGDFGRWEHLWHPDPALNPPGPVHENVPLPDGDRGTIVASAPGVLDVVRNNPGSGR